MEANGQLHAPAALPYELSSSTSPDTKFLKPFFHELPENKVYRKYNIHLLVLSCRSFDMLSLILCTRHKNK